MYATRSQSTPLNGAVALRRHRRSRLLSRVSGSGLSRSALWAIATLVAIGLGWAISRGDVKYVVGAAGIGAFVLLVVEAPGPLAALLLLAVLNGIPFVNLGAHKLLGLKVEDAAVFGLAVLLFAYWDRHPSRERARIFRAAAIWSACFIGWWTYELLRSHLLDGIPWLQAVLFCRDFLYFAILLPLALRARIPAASLRTGGLVLLAGVTLVALGRDVQGITGRSLSWLVHPIQVRTTVGLPRLYSYMSYIINTALMFAAALLLSRESRGRRWPIAALVAVLFADAALELGRANYFGLVVALLVAVVLGLYSARQGGSVARLLVRAMITVVVLVVVVLAISVAGGGNLPIIHDVISRATSGVSALTHSTGTVGYREQLDTTMLALLGNKWLIGLGFLHPAVRYFSSLPLGSIRNPDTGVFNALMTMGVIGAAFIYVPLLYALRELFRAGRRIRPAAPSVPRWVLLGAAAWIAWVIAVSPTLEVLFSTQGLAMSALALGVVGRLITAPGSVPAVVESPAPLPQLAGDAI